MQLEDKLSKLQSKLDDVSLDSDILNEELLGNIFCSFPLICIFPNLKLIVLLS